jgi:hypothetical protein
MGSTTTTTIEGSLPLSLFFFFLLIIGITIHETHQQETIVTITNITKAWNSLWASNYIQKEKKHQGKEGYSHCC